jgi:dienelactone hydrolase
MTQGTASIAMRGSYNPSAAHLARERSLQFLRKYLA